MNLIGDRKANVTEFLNKYVNVRMENEMKSNLDVCFSRIFITFLLSSQQFIYFMCQFVFLLLFFDVELRKPYDVNILVMKMFQFGDKYNIFFVKK